MNAALPLYLAQAQAEAGWINFVPMLLIFAIFWVVLILPMRRRQKKLQETVAALKRGDEVLTTGGIYGEVAAIQENFILLKISDDNTRIKVDKAYIAGLARETEGGSK